MKEETQDQVLEHKLRHYFLLVIQLLQEQLLIQNLTMGLHGLRLMN